MTIRNKIAAVRAPKKKRSAVHVANEAQAASVRRQWQTEDAIRDVNARVMAVAEHADSLVSDAVRKTAANAIARGVEDAMAAAARQAALTTAAEHEAEREREKKRQACRAEYDQRMDEAGEERDRENKAAYAEYSKRHDAVSRDNRYLYPSTLAAKDVPAYDAKIKDMSHDAFFDLISTEYDEHTARNSGIHKAQVEAAGIVLKAQLAAINCDEAPPAPEAIPGLIIVDKDGTTKRT